MQELEQKTVVRVWDQNYSLIGELPEEAKGKDEGVIELPIDHPVAQAIMERVSLTTVNLTIDSTRGRWSGALDSYKVIKPQGWFNTKILECTFFSHADRFKQLADMHEGWTNWEA
jgi:hypothetical protein